MAAPTARRLGHAEERRHRDLVHRVEAADWPGRRHRHADDQQRHHEERTQVAERHMKRARRHPDSRRDRQPQRKRQQQRDEQPRRLAHDAEPLRESFDEAGDRRAPASPAGRARSAAPSAPSRSGCPARTKNTTSPATDAAAASSPPSLHPRDTARDRRTATPGRRAHEDAEQQQHGDQVEQPLQDDGRERRGRRQMLARAPAGTAAALRRRGPAAGSWRQSR